MNKKDIQAFRNLLLGFRRRLAASVSDMQRDAFGEKGEPPSELSDVPLEHLADRGTDSFTRDLMIGMIENKEAELVDIDRALEKIDEGTYGKCENCEADIPRKRLKALPFARLCIGCKQREEENSGMR